MLPSFNESGASSFIEAFIISYISVNESKFWFSSFNKLLLKELSIVFIGSIILTEFARAIRSFVLALLLPTLVISLSRS